MDRFGDLLRMVDDLAVAQEPSGTRPPTYALSLAAGALNRFVTVEVLSDRPPSLAAITATCCQACCASGEDQLSRLWTAPVEKL